MATKHPKTDDLRRRWIDYVQEISRMRWNIIPNTPDHARFNKAFTILMQLAQGMKSTGEIEVGDTVTNGKDTFEVVRVEEDRVYDTENTFVHSNTLRIKSKFKE